jgi:hypothetical protein
MTSTNIADATHKLMRAELSDKNSLSYEEDVFKVIMCKVQSCFDTFFLFEAYR